MATSDRFSQICGIKLSDITHVRDLFNDFLDAWGGGYIYEGH